MIFSLAPWPFSSYALRKAAALERKSVTAKSQRAKVNIPKDLSTDNMRTFKDLVEVSKTLAPGDYVLSFRRDCLESPQIWSACANIDIV